MSFAASPKSDLVSLLRSQVQAKMDYGIQHKIIGEYMGMVPIDNEQYSGFYTIAFGMHGGYEFSAVLEHKKPNNAVIELTLLCPEDWGPTAPRNTFVFLLKSMTNPVN
jgi:hypothetical protein